MPQTDPARFLMFVHGLGGSPLTWENQVSKLPADLPAHAPWLRGLRPGGTESFDVQAAAGDLLMALQLEGVGQAALVGHELGALVALQAAAQAPDVVSHLVLISGQAPPTKAALRAQRFALSFVSRRRLADAGLSKERLREALGSGGMLDGLADPADVVAPTLVVAGSRDRAGMRGAQALAAGIPDARLEVVEGAGAAPMAQAPQEVNRLVYDFLGHGA